MRSLAIFFIILLVLAGAIVAFVVLTTPHQAADFHPRLDEIAVVPASAEVFAIIPTAAALDGKLHANPVTRAAIERWRANQPLPRPWMIGNADLIAWKSGGAMHYFVRVDALRALIVRTFVTSGAIDINVLPGDRLDGASVAEIRALAAKLPPGDALVVQRGNARGAYPPIGRPSATSVSITPAEIRLTSVGPASAGLDRPKPVHTPEAVLAPRFPRGAVLSVAFTTQPRLLGDLNRLFGAKISGFFGDGGMLCIYDVNTRTFLPRPLAVIVVPDTPQRRADIAALGALAHTGERDGMLLISFDRSIEQYQNDALDAAPAAGNQWTLRIDPLRLVPILKQLSNNVGLRIIAPRLYRSTRDLEGWIGGLEQAKVIDASESAGADGETLQVRIAAK